MPDGFFIIFIQHTIAGIRSHSRRLPQVETPSIQLNRTLTPPRRRHQVGNGPNLVTKNALRTAVVWPEVRGPARV
jgi:hypothetical protein